MASLHHHRWAVSLRHVAFPLLVFVIALHAFQIALMPWV